MKSVIQRVSKASVTINQITVAEINAGVLVFIGIEDADTDEDVIWLSNKIINLRIFDDENKIPNISVKDINGDILLVSQFTLHAATNNKIAEIIIALMRAIKPSLCCLFVLIAVNIL